MGALVEIDSWPTQVPSLSFGSGWSSTTALKLVRYRLRGSSVRGGPDAENNPALAGLVEGTLAERV